MNASFYGVDVELYLKKIAKRSYGFYIPVKFMHSWLAVGFLIVLLSALLPGFRRNY